MSEHTPGPWEHSEHGDSLLDAFRIFAPFKPAPVAETIGDTAVSIANARLISAAPELLEACRDMLQALIDDGYEPEAGLLSHARRVIQKATGAA